MRLLKTVPGALVAIVLGLAALGVGLVGYRVYKVIHPKRVVEPIGELASALVKVEEIEFNASDGVALQGWLLEGRPGFPPVVLCPDRGVGKASLVTLALALQEAGFTVLTFDFRGQGDSGGDGSGLGVLEKHDVLGAVDFLGGRGGGDRGPKRIGVYGVGMGAHAAVLAAADRPAVRVMVLDGLYPDASYPLIGDVYGGWQFGERHLRFLPEALFATLSRTQISSRRAADVLPRLLGRDLLLVAPAGDVRLAGEIQKMYEGIPEQADADGNLVTLPATGTGRLYGEDLGRYHRQVASFFTDRLSPS